MGGLKATATSRQEVARPYVNGLQLGGGQHFCFTRLLNERSRFDKCTLEYKVAY